ncbi:MAG: hypothetical protein ACRESR_01170 [Gammaproteobacteria bacterium]
MGAAVLAAAAAGLALAALYLFASGLLGGMLAALVTAGGALVLAGFLALGSRCCRAWHRGARRRRSEGPEELADVLVHLLRRNAKKATLAALVAGVALGVSPQLRRSVIRLLREFSKSKP